MNYEEIPQTDKFKPIDLNFKLNEDKFEPLPETSFKNNRQSKSRHELNSEDKISRLKTPNYPYLKKVPSDVKIPKLASNPKKLGIVLSTFMDKAEVDKYLDTKILSNPKYPIHKIDQLKKKKALLEHIMVILM